MGVDLYARKVPVHMISVGGSESASARSAASNSSSMYVSVHTCTNARRHACTQGVVEGWLACACPDTWQSSRRLKITSLG